MRAEVYLETNVSKVSEDLDTLTGAVMHERHPIPVKAMILITCAVKADTHPVPVNSSHIYYKFQINFFFQRSKRDFQQRRNHTCRKSF
jgi:hypothetical protein